MSIVLPACKQNFKLEKEVTLPDYASGSGIVYFRERIYLIGDDMNYVLVLDPDFNRVDSIKLSDKSEARAAKETKQDLESASIIRINRLPFLLLMGSGSLDPYRNNAWLIDLKTGEKNEISLHEFYQRIALSGIKEFNIEGAVSIPGSFILSNRGNKSFPKNHLVVTTPDFYRKQNRARIKLIKVGGSEDTSTFNGVSGLDYSQRSDQLLLTVSTENTYSTYSDGAIGKSYLWIINNISAKKRMAALNPDKVIDLEALDKRFAGQKIESVSILNETREEIQLIMAADNDKGNTVLFRMTLRK